MTAYENVEFGLRVSGFDAKRKEGKGRRVLNYGRPAKRMHIVTQELSGIEQQRVAIARAIAHRPKWFCHEPTAELDTNMGLQVIKGLKRPGPRRD